jgi:ABC-type transport system involved in multi-copper enzyme maturation permease subunit
MPTTNSLILGISSTQLLIAAILVAAAIVTLTWRFARSLGWQMVTYILVTVLTALAGLILCLATRVDDFMGIWYVVGMIGMTLSAMAIFLGVMEFGCMRLLGLLRLGAIARVTYYEALLQPFTIIILVSGITALGLCARLGFFTYNEDFKMYRDVASSFVFLFSLPIMVFASTKVIDEEIENRTMLTLMSKPVSRTQVVLGKYVGVLMLILATVVILGMMAAMCGYLRYYDDMLIDYRVADPVQIAKLELDNYKAFLALLPSVVLTFLQVSTLGAISVAVSTRFGLAVNVTVVAVIYIAASLAKYIGGAAELPAVVRGGISLLAYLLPGLSDLDLNQRLVFSNFMLGKDTWMPGMPYYSQIWQYVGLAAAYSVLYIGAVLSFGVGLFRSRELT